MHKYGAAFEHLIWTLDGLRPSRKLQRVWLPDALAFNRAPDKYLTVAAIAKNEGRHLPEWITFHANLGVEHFYIYDNHSTDNTTEVLAPFVHAGIVTVIPWPDFVRGWEGVVGPQGRMQRLAYAHALSTWGATSRWMAFIDIDEFILPLSTDSIPAFLSDYEDLPTVCAWWKIFIAGEHELPEAALVTEMITTAGDLQPGAPSKFWRFKSFVDPRRVRGVFSTHMFIFDDGLAYGINESRHHIPYFRDSSADYYSNRHIQINHYYRRGAQDVAKRKDRQSSLHNRVLPDSFVEFVMEHPVTDTRAVKHVEAIRTRLKTTTSSFKRSNQ
jgi:hypothetical protein